MTTIKYSLMLILSAVSVVSGGEIFKGCASPLAAVMMWWKKKPLRHWSFWAKAALVAATIALSAIEDCDSARDREELNARLEDQSRLLGQQQASLAQANTALAEQARSLGSVVFNVKASDEGKERFLRAFDVLGRLPKVNASATGFAGLVLDDGVAVYWFENKTETVTGFRFFSNADVNRVLCGIPIGQDFVGTNGSINLARTGELAIAFDEVLFRRTPRNSANALEAARSRSVVLDEIAEILCYVYRAEGIRFHAIARGLPGHEKPDGSFAVSFDYVVNPLAENPVRRYVSGIGGLTLSAAFLRSLHGIPMSDFSQKVIAELRRQGVEPTIRVSDVSLLEDRRKARHPDSDRRIFGPVAYHVIERAGVVGYRKDRLTKGSNDVKVDFRAINRPFATLADVLSFSPAHALVGDEIVFGAGTSKTSYRVESCDGTNGVLRPADGNGGDALTFDAIPFCDRFTIRHNNETNVAVTASGEIGTACRDLFYAPSSADESGAWGQVEIRHEGSSASSSADRILLRGGTIRQEIQDRQDRRTE